MFALGNHSSKAALRTRSTSSNLPYHPWSPCHHDLGTQHPPS
jgi:hypothetical protein